MKIRLIQPAQLDEAGRLIKYRKLFFPNLTLPTLAALTPDDVEVNITTEYVQDIDFDEDVDLVGITAQTCQAPRAYQVSDEFRKRGRKTIMGGTHASACPDEALRHFDSVLIGEAEGLWDGVLKDAEADRLRQTYTQEEKPPLSRPAIPRYDLLDFKHYVIPPLARTPLMPFQATRGCPHACDFCSVSRFFGHKIRAKPVANVIREIESLSPSRVFFTDDNIIASPEYSRRLFAALKPLKTRWACQMSTDVHKHPDLIDAAAGSGCHETLIGIESLSEENLKSINKGFNAAKEYAGLFKRLASVGILAQASVIVGFDRDTPEEAMRMIDAVLQLDVNYVYIGALTPFPGTPLHERLSREGKIAVSDWSQYDVVNTVISPANMSADAMKAVIWDMYEKFYSTRNILKRTWRFGKQYVRFFPRDNCVEETFFQFCVRNAVRRRAPPFALGLRLNNHASPDAPQHIAD